MASRTTFRGSLAVYGGKLEKLLSEAVKTTTQVAVQASAQVGVAEPEVARADDMFSKAYTFTRADEAVAAGMHPYFKPIAEQHGGSVVVDGREMVITGSNDYLGLTQDPRLKTAAREALENFGTSCTGSRFLTGTLTLHEALETRLAEFLRAESALTFSAGFLGSLAVLSAIAGRHDIFYFDRENHACLFDGARLSYGTLRKFEHNNIDDLETLLRRDADKPGGRMIVTDGVFSMSGQIARLPELVKVARRYGARVVVDDAHATGVLGRSGRGTAEHFGLEREVDLILGHLLEVVRVGRRVCHGAARGRQLYQAQGAALYLYGGAPGDADGGGAGGV